MQNLRCSQCQNSRLTVKEIEFRHINVRNMVLASLEKMLEVECQHCGYVECRELPIAASLV